MASALEKTFQIYAQSFRLIAASSALVLFSLVLLYFIASYVAGGASFLRFSSVYLDFSPLQAIVIAAVALISLFLLSMFLAALVTIVKLKETLDNNSFSKVAAVFPRYVRRVFTFLLIVGFLSILLGVVLDALNVPRAITHLILLVFWLVFTFTPQILVLEDLDIMLALQDTIAFIKRVPQAVPAYAVFGFVALFLVSVVEVALGQFLIWEHKVISLMLTLFVALPLLQIFATEYYIQRYPLSKL
ncbi:hypothetical protein HYS54_05460 [Candidatus Micrarchaeota archaeon]|nr:hypothetical protein [Candidatus Micrarchaeota archaeon]